MKKIALFIVITLVTNALIAQTTLIGNPNPEVYVGTTLSHQQLQQIALGFSVDKVVKNADNTFNVRICVGKREYADFMDLQIPFSIVQPPKANVSMASSYDQLVSSWNRYPTYETYLAAMDTFQSQFPELCEIDTVLAETPNHHMILAAHISNDLTQRGNKPALWYSSTMHGDEVVGYYLMIHLIHYLLNNYATNDQVRNLVDNIDIWITPLENPDGTYHSGDNTLNSSPTSTRYNANGEDLNRSYPEAGESVGNINNYEPEIIAMMNFGEAHQFTMSANFHGGSELVNYPWDAWETDERHNPDGLWWDHVGNRFVDTCHEYNNDYMDDGVTEGGDWYVITGSRQDYFNYFQRCREVTMEISGSKVVSSNRLPNYWNNIRAGLLTYMGECLHGFRGIVTDSITGEPLNATIRINNFDDDISYVTTIMPTGNYHRPIQSGSYDVTYSATGYTPKTLQVDVIETQSFVQDVQLVPIGYGIENPLENAIQLYPNPSNGQVFINGNQMAMDKVTIYDVCGKMIKTVPAEDTMLSIDLSDCPAGVYFVKISTKSGEVTKKLMVRNE